MKRQTTKTLLIPFLALCMTAASAGAANAAPAFDPLAAVQNVGVLASASDLATQMSTERSAAAAESIGTTDSGTPTDLRSSRLEDISITPKSASALPPVRQLSAGAEVHVYNGDSFGFVTGKNRDGMSAAFVAINSASSPSSYDFTITGANGPLVLALQPNGSVLVSNVAGQVVNHIGAPWATDAAGQSLDTTYTVRGDVITQKVALDDAAFPVVADPSASCDWLWCTLKFNKLETLDISTGVAYGITIVVRLCGLVAGAVGAGACAVGIGPIIVTAMFAVNRHECVAFRMLTIGGGLQHPFIYSGGYCR